MEVLNGASILLLLILSLFTSSFTGTVDGADAVKKSGRNGAEEDYSSWDGIKNTVMSKFYSKFGIFPSTDDPLLLNETSMSFDNDFIRGNISILNGTMTGLSKLSNDFSVNIFTQKVTIKVSVAKLRLTGRYKADGFISLQMIEDAAANVSKREVDESSLNSSSVLHSTSSNSNLTSSGFYGNGHIIALISGLSAEVTCQLFMNGTSGKLAFTHLDADISFKSVQVNATNMKIKESTVDWLKVSRAIKPNFERIWQNKKAGLLSSILEEVNQKMNSDLRISTLKRFMTMAGRKLRRGKSKDVENKQNHKGKSHSMINISD